MFGGLIDVPLKQVAKFALISGAGLVLDLVIYSILLTCSLRAGYANLISAATAVTFVYFVSTRKVFAYNGKFLIHLFVVYVIYQAAAVTVASWAVDTLVRISVLPIVAKMLILPITFLANYVFMRFLTNDRVGRQNPNVKETSTAFDISSSKVLF